MEKKDNFSAGSNPQFYSWQGRGGGGGDGGGVGDGGGGVTRNR